MTQATLLGPPRVVMATTGQGALKGYSACAQEPAAITTVHLVPYGMAVSQGELGRLESRNHSFPIYV